MWKRTFIQTPGRLADNSADHISGWQERKRTGDFVDRDDDDRSAPDPADEIYMCVTSCISASLGNTGIDPFPQKAPVLPPQ